jgi:hypothetical protein
MIDISEVINVTISTPPAGIAEQNVSNLACFTKDTPVVSSSAAFRVYMSSIDVATDWGTTSKVYKAAVAVFSQSPNIITGGGKFIVVPVGSSETSQTALARIVPQVFFGGFATTFSETNTEILHTSADAQAAGKIFGIASADDDDLVTPGLFFEVQAQTLTRTRCFFHNDSDQLVAMKWGYLSRGMSTNFSGTNTASSMHLKQIAGVTADVAITETQRGHCETVGADVYVSIAGRATVLSYGANWVFDEVYNLAWFKMALEVAGFNALAETSTKLPQTESGMDMLKSAYRGVCEMGLSNGMIGAGKWTGTDTFGDPQDFARCVLERGYRIYSQPISQQSSVDRAARKAPLVQIAAKFAGAIHHSDVIVNINK